MARPHVVALREFYASSLGKLVRRHLLRAVKQSWPELGDDTLGGVGYANPILRSFLRQERRDKALVLSLMPAAQGAIVWPDYRANRAVLYQAGAFPIADNHLNRLLLVHALEHSEDEQRLIQECWRVLTPGGRLIVVVPRRRSLWSGVQDTPLSYGKPFTSSQLRDTVCQQFTHIETRSCLFFPPSSIRWVMKLSDVLERVGHWITPMLGGVVMMEVEKQIYAGVKEKRHDMLTRPAYVPIGSKPALSPKKSNI